MASILEGAENRGGCCAWQISVIECDQRRFSAKLKDDALERFTGCGRNASAGRHGSRKADLRYPRMRDERRACFRSKSSNNINDTVWQPRLLH
nr:hypothetical protein [Bradyrhizobium sp. CCBAU 53415]